MSVSQDKDAGSMARELCPIARDVIVTRYQMHRAMPVDQLIATAHRYAPDARSAPTVPDAIRAADELAGPDDIIIVAGSIFAVGDAISYFSDHHNEAVLT
jgi:dihydrofolate synthase/folylpolyglutamate synthase